MPFSRGVVRGNFELLTGSSYVYAIAEFIVASIAIITRTEITSFFTRIPPLTHFVLYSSYYAKQGIPDCPASFFHLLKSLYSSITFASNISFLIESITIMYIAPKFISIFLTIFVYHLISKIVFHLLIVNEKIRNFAQIPITGARCAPLQCCGKRNCALRARVLCNIRFLLNNCY